MNPALMFGAVVTRGVGLLMTGVRACGPYPRPRRRRPSNRVFLQVEWLEDRTVPNAYSFSNAMRDGNWNTRGNWNDANGNQVQDIPGANDTATIPSNKTCTVDQNASASSVNIAGAGQGTGCLIVPGGIQLTVSGGITNNGTLQISGGTSTVIGSIWNDNYCYLSGKVQGDVNNSQELKIAGGIITGTLAQDGGSSLLVNNGGTIRTLSNDGGTVSLLTANTVLTVQVNFSQTGTGLLEMSAGGANISQLQVGGQATLAGSMTVNLVGVAPGRQQQYVPITWAGHTGWFSNDLGEDRIGNFDFVRLYLPQGGLGAGNLGMYVPDPILSIQMGGWIQYAGVDPGEYTWLDTFSDGAVPGLSITDYTFQISWGDGSVSTWSGENTDDIMIVQVPGATNEYQIYGSHTYMNPGTPSVVVTVTDNVSDVPWSDQGQTVWVYPS